MHAMHWCGIKSGYTSPGGSNGKPQGKRPSCFPGGGGQKNDKPKKINWAFQKKSVVSFSFKPAKRLPAPQKAPTPVYKKKN